LSVGSKTAGPQISGPRVDGLHNSNVDATVRATLTKLEKGESYQEERQESRDEVDRG